MMVKARSRAGCLVPLILLLAIGGYLVYGPVREKSPAEAAADRLQGAMIRCENETKSRLADPSGFDAEPYGQWLQEPGGSETALAFQFKARARNGFGALVWAEFACRATYDGTHWSAEVAQR